MINTQITSNNAAANLNKSDLNLKNEEKQSSVQTSTKEALSAALKKNLGINTDNITQSIIGQDSGNEDLNLKLKSLINKVLNDLNASASKQTPLLKENATNLNFAPNFSNELKNLTTELSKNEVFKEVLQKLESILKPMNEIKVSNMSELFKSSGVFLEAKLKDALNPQSLPQSFHSLINAIKGLSSEKIANEILNFAQKNLEPKASLEGLKEILTSQKTQNQETIKNSPFKTLLALSNKVENFEKYLSKNVNVAQNKITQIAKNFLNTLQKLEPSFKQELTRPQNIVFQNLNLKELNTAFEKLKNDLKALIQGEKISTQDKTNAQTNPKVQSQPNTQFINTQSKNQATNPTIKDHNSTFYQTQQSADETHKEPAIKNQTQANDTIKNEAHKQENTQESIKESVKQDIKQNAQEAIKPGNNEVKIIPETTQENIKESPKNTNLKNQESNNLKEPNNSELKAEANKLTDMKTSTLNAEKSTQTKLTSNNQPSQNSTQASTFANTQQASTQASNIQSQTTPQNQSMQNANLAQNETDSNPQANSTTQQQQSTNTNAVKNLIFLSENESLSELESLSKDLSALNRQLTRNLKELDPNASSSKLNLNDIKNIEKKTARALDDLDQISTKTDKQISQSIKNDIKSTLLQTANIAKSVGDEATLNVANRLLTQIELNQLISLANDSFNTYVPYFWEDLQDSKLMFKRGKKDKFFAQIKLDFKSLGQLEVLVALNNDKYIDINIMAENKEFRKMIYENAHELKKAINQAGLLSSNFFVGDIIKSKFDDFNDTKTRDYEFEMGIDKEA